MFSVFRDIPNIFSVFKEAIKTSINIHEYFCHGYFFTNLGDTVESYINETNIFKIMVEIINYHFLMIQVSTWYACMFTNFFTYDLIFKVLHLTYILIFRYL